MKFEEKFVESGRIRNLRDLDSFGMDSLEMVWKNRRSWHVAWSSASYLSDLGDEKNLDDRGAIRFWASESSLEDWEKDPIGGIRGVGITTYQYLRMMGGVDTAMPDSVVRKVVEQILHKAEVEMPTEGDLELVRTVDRMASIAHRRPIEICWMTWLIQSEGEQMRMEKYRYLLERI